jgi:FkbM family methyltransferase
VIKDLLQRAMFRCGYRIEGVRYTPRHLLKPDMLRTMTFDDAVCRQMFEAGEACVFIQVGAFDGVANDPLRRFVERCGWRGAMLEPQPMAAAALRDLYRDNAGIVILQAAVDQARGSRTLYVVDGDGLPDWAGQLASFEREHIAKHAHLIPGVETRIQALEVECITFADVLDRLQTDRLDVLQIDAEGADGYLLSLFPFDRVKPAIIHWEIKNMTRAQQEASLDLVCGHGYRVARSGGEDMLAMLPTPAGRG